MNYLDICKMAARESRVVPVEPVTTVNQVGKLYKLVKGVNDVYRDLQIERDWLWMRREFTSPFLAIGSSRYTSTAWAITRFGSWAHDRQAAHAGDIAYYPYTIYDTAVGIQDESTLEEITYQEWRVLYGRGGQTNGRPRQYAISPINEFCLGQAPDLATYKVKGENYLGPQDLTVDVSIPELPDAFHQYLAWAAITRLREGDEASPQVITAAINNAARIKGAILRSQTEGYTVGGGPIA